MADRTAATAGLKGCIRLLDVNNQMYDLREKGSDVMYGSGVGECGNDPCHPNPCHHGGICHVKEAEMFHCECLSTYTGEGTGLGQHQEGLASESCSSSLINPKACGITSGTTEMQLPPWRLNRSAQQRLRMGGTGSCCVLFKQQGRNLRRQHQSPELEGDQDPRVNLPLLKYAHKSLRHLGC